jgi:16S rRNA (cytosine1402-N4)-methyltransferase
MRMDAGQELTAEAVLAEASESELGRWFWEWGGEREARRLARVICRERQVRRLRTTRELAQLIERVVPRRGQRLHPATRVFMALRMWVNGEVEEIERGLPVVWSLLRTGGRMVVISFHSVEDRLVKRFGRERSLPYETMGEVDVPELRRPRVPELREVVRRPLEPGADEVAANPRARSARMRIFERCAAESSR